MIIYSKNAPFFTLNTHASPFSPMSYISTIIADMKMRASYNNNRRGGGVCEIIADMKMRASYNIIGRF